MSKVAPERRETKFEQIKADTLAWLQEHNPGLEEIPCGKMGSAMNCPLARGLGGRTIVGFNTYIRNGARAQKLSPQASRFRAYFDQGWFPELDESLSGPWMADENPDDPAAQ